MNFFVFRFKKLIKFKLIHEVELQSKTNKEKSTEMFPPRLLKPKYICACALPRVKKGQQKVPTR